MYSECCKCNFRMLIKASAMVEDKKAIYSVSDVDRAARAVEKTRVANKSWAERRRELSNNAQRKASATPLWCRETYTLPREQAREQARRFFQKYPKAAYWSEVENWRVLDDGLIEFTMRRLPSAD